MKDNHMKNQTMKNKTMKKAGFGKSGFSLVEVIMVVAVMAVLASMTAPAIMAMIGGMNERREQVAMANIQKALESYATNIGRLPLETVACTGAGNWGAELARFSTLSVDQICNDAFGATRVYRVYSTAPQVFLDAQFPVDYATVTSFGRNRFDNASNFTATTPTTVNWETHDNSAVAGTGDDDKMANFQDLVATADDMVVKYSNAQGLINNYHVTLQRMKDIAAALEVYAKGKYNESISANQTSANRPVLVYYPPSMNMATADSARYYRGTVNDMATFFPFATWAAAAATVNTHDAGASDNYAALANTTRVYNDSNNVLRRNAMIQLMRMLGLPDTHCCSAMHRDRSNPPLERAFFYYSNPRVRTGNAIPSQCGTRPINFNPVGAATPATTGNIFLSPRIRVGDNGFSHATNNESTDIGVGSTTCG